MRTSQLCGSCSSACWATSLAFTGFPEARRACPRSTEAVILRVSQHQHQHTRRCCLQGCPGHTAAFVYINACHKVLVMCPEQHTAVVLCCMLGFRRILGLIQPGWAQHNKMAAMPYLHKPVACKRLSVRHVMVPESPQ